MQVIVKGRHTSVPESVKELAVQKITKVRRFFDRINVLEIEFSKEHNPRVAVARKHHVEVTLTTKDHLIRASANGPDPASAVDAVVDKLEAQVKRLKGKIVRRGSRASANGARRGSISSKAPNPGNHSVESAEIEPAEGEVAPVIAHTTRFVVKPMTPEEAVLQMQSLGHDFMLFLNAESDHPGVVYRRRDGTFGLVEPA